MSTTPRTNFSIPAADLGTEALLALREQVVLSNNALTQTIDAELRRRAGGSSPVAPPPPAPAPAPKRSRLDGIVSALVTIPVVMLVAGVVGLPLFAVGSAVVSVARRALAPAPAPVVAPAPAPAPAPMAGTVIRPGEFNPLNRQIQEPGVTDPVCSLTRSHFITPR